MFNMREKGVLEYEHIEDLTRSGHHDATLLNPGPPALYQLNTERKYIDKTNRKVRQWTYGRKDENQQNKVILLVGETEAGKTTIINTLTNYLLGVKFEDQEFYQITEEEENKDQSVSQTSDITVYEVFVEENPISLTIINTPGYGDTEGYEKDFQISEYLIRLFSNADGIHYIDAVCFVMKASQNRLSGKELYIFHSVLSLFGRDIENNIVFLLTQSDGEPPTDALNAIEKAEIPCRRDEDNQPVYFLFNNRQKEKRYKRYVRVLKSSWEMGEDSLNEFFTLLDEKNRKSVEMTLDVLKERRRLEACVSNLKELFQSKDSIRNFENPSIIVSGDLKTLNNKKSKLLHEAYESIMSLSKFSVKPDSAFTLQHLDFLIPRLKEEEGKEEWVKNLEGLRKTGEQKRNKGALQRFNGEKWGQFKKIVGL